MVSAICLAIAAASLAGAFHLWRAEFRAIV